MLSNNELKWINSLKNRKYRLKHRAYIAEGPRLVNELLHNGQQALKIIKTGEINLPISYDENIVHEVTKAELKRLSLMVQPNGVLAVFQMPEEHPVENHPKGSWGFALDFIQDPGNLGTIIRTMAWFDIQNLYCSSDSVDTFNPKVVQASMGGIGNVRPHYVDLAEFLSAQSIPVYAADMNGESIEDSKLSPGIIVLGNEGRGISDEIRSVCQNTISIPKPGNGESLNVAVSSAILAAWVSLKAI